MFCINKICFVVSYFVTLGYCSIVLGIGCEGVFTLLAAGGKQYCD